MDKQKCEIYKAALEKYGVGAQIGMLTEECGELLSAINKFNRSRCSSDDVLTELADVSIMVEQLSLIYGGYEKFQIEKDKKLIRLLKRINNNGDNS